MVENWLGSKATGEFKTTYESEYILDVTLRGPSSIYASPLDSLEVVIDIAQPGCAGSHFYDYEFF